MVRLGSKVTAVAGGQPRSNRDALTESVNNFQVRHRIVFSALDLIYLFDLITGRRRSAHQQRCAGIRSRAECASLEAIIDAQFGWRI